VAARVSPGPNSFTSCFLKLRTLLEERMVLNLSELNSLLCNWLEELADQVFGLGLHISWVDDLDVEDSMLQLFLACTFERWSTGQHFEEKNAK